MFSFGSNRMKIGNSRTAQELGEETKNFNAIQCSVLDSRPSQCWGWKVAGGVGKVGIGRYQSHWNEPRNPFVRFKVPNCQAFTYAKSKEPDTKRGTNKS